MVRLGWSHGDQEVVSVDEMIELFDIKDVNKSASTFDVEKLTWLNQQYVMHEPAEALVPGLRKHLANDGLDPDAGPPLELVVDAYRERARTLAEMAEACWYLFRDFDHPDATAAKKHLRPVIVEPLQRARDRLAGLERWSRDAIHAAIQATADEAGLGFGKLGQPLRVALAGGPVSPPIDVTAELVGRDRALNRMDDALQFIAQRASGG